MTDEQPNSILLGELDKSLRENVAETSALRTAIIELTARTNIIQLEDRRANDGYSLVSFNATQRLALHRRLQHDISGEYQATTIARTSTKIFAVIVALGTAGSFVVGLVGLINLTHHG